MLLLEWRPSPRFVAGEIDAVADRLSNLEAPLQMARQIIVAATAAYFASGAGPDGPWAQWARDYPESESILVQTKAMLQAATDRGNYRVRVTPLGGDVVFIGSSSPAYAFLHQNGTIRMPARPWLGLTGETEGSIFAMFEAWMANALEIVSYPSRGMSAIVQRGAGGRFASTGIYV